MTRIAAIGVSIILLAAGCGSDGDAQDIEADTAAAEAALLVLADLPEGWSEAPSTSTDDDEMDRRQAECLGAPGDELFDTEAKAETDTFSDGAGGQIEQVVALMPTADDAVDTLAGFEDEDAAPCLTEAFNDRFRSVVEDSGDLGEASLGEITVAPLEVADAGDETHAFRIEIPITLGDASLTVTADLVAVRVGRSLAGLTFTSETGATPVALIDEITGITAERLDG